MTATRIDVSPSDGGPPYQVVVGVGVLGELPGLVPEGTRTVVVIHAEGLGEIARPACGALRGRGGVLALGSGAVLDPRIESLLDGLPVVYLSAGFGTVAQRIGLDRPRVVIPGNPRGRLRVMLDERDAIYQRLAAVTVPTDDLDPDEVADQIAAEVTKR